MCGKIYVFEMFGRVYEMFFENEDELDVDLMLVRID